MQCYFMRAGHIEAVEELPGLSDEEAIAKAHALFSERTHLFEGFELWDRTCFLIRPQPAPQREGEETGGSGLARRACITAAPQISCLFDRAAAMRQRPHPTRSLMAP